MDKETLTKLLHRIFRGGLHRLPKKQSERLALLALSLVPLDPEGIFDQAEIDAHIFAWLNGLSGFDGVIDHVTWRRALVDYGFLRRATDGAIYRIRPETLDEALTADARTVDAQAIFVEVELARDERKEKFGKS